MDKDSQLVLTAQEAKVVAQQLLDQWQSDNRQPVGLTPQQALRLAAKLDRYLVVSGDFGTVFADVPTWARQVIHDTYAPLHKPVKKAAPKARARSSRKTAGPSRKDLPPKPAPITELPEVLRTIGDAAAADVKPSPAAARRLGGLMRARGAAFAKGDNQRVSALDRRIAALRAAPAAVHAHS